MEESNVSISATSRFILYNKKLWIEKKKILLWGAGAYLGFWMLFGIMVGLMRFTIGEFTTSVYCFFSYIVGTFVASEMFYDIAKKNGRISVLMTPVSAIDVFVSRFLIVVVGYFILSVVGYCFFELTNLLTYSVIKMDMPTPYNPLNLINEIAGPESFFLITTGYLFYISIYMFGAVTWPKLSFLKTVFILSVAQTIFWILLMIIVFAFSDNLIIGTALRTKSVAWIWIGINLILTCSLIYLSYRNFKRKTLIQKI